jgi:hypothetical protein
MPLPGKHNAAQREYGRSAALVSHRRQAEATQDLIPPPPARARFLS